MNRHLKIQNNINEILIPVLTKIILDYIKPCDKCADATGKIIQSGYRSLTTMLFSHCNHCLRTFVDSTNNYYFKYSCNVNKIIEIAKEKLVKNQIIIVLRNKKFFKKIKEELNTITVFSPVETRHQNNIIKEFNDENIKIITITKNIAKKYLFKSKTKPIFAIIEV